MVRANEDHELVKLGEDFNWYSLWNECDEARSSLSFELDQAVVHVAAILASLFLASLFLASLFLASLFLASLFLASLFLAISARPRAKKTT